MKSLAGRIAALGIVSSGLALAFGSPTPDSAPDVRLATLGFEAVAEPGLHAEWSSEDLDRLVQRTCVACHNDQLRTAELSLQGFQVASAAQHADIAEAVITKLRLDMMPPPGVPRPGGDSLRLLAEALEVTIDQAAASDPTPGTRRFQRLSQGEYERVIRDLLGLEVDASRWLPSDMYAAAYDTWSNVQGLSLTALDAYLSAADAISRMAVGNPGATRTLTEYSVPIEMSQHAWSQLEGAPYGTRGGIVVMKDFPVDGTYVFSVETVFGQGTGFEDIDISIDGVQVALLAVPHGGGPGSVLDGGRGLPLETEPIFVSAGQRQVAAAFVRKIDGLYEDRLEPHAWSVAGGEDSQSWADYELSSRVVDWGDQAASLTVVSWSCWFSRSTWRPSTKETPARTRGRNVAPSRRLQRSSAIRRSL